MYVQNKRELSLLSYFSNTKIVCTKQAGTSFLSLFSYFCNRKNVKSLTFQALQVPSWNIKRFLSLGLESPISWNIKNFLKVDYFYFLGSESNFLKYKRNIKLESSISGNIKKFRFPKFKKVLRDDARKCVR